MIIKLNKEQRAVIVAALRCYWNAHRDDNHKAGARAAWTARHLLESMEEYMLNTELIKDNYEEARFAMCKERTMCNGCPFYSVDEKGHTVNCVELEECDPLKVLEIVKMWREENGRNKAE